MTLRTLAQLTLSSVLLASVVETPAQAAEGAAQQKMIAALKATAEGTCPDEIMSPLLVDQCEQQLPTNRKILNELGPIQSATYRGRQELGNGVRAEAYRVDFQKGVMTWLASLDGEGKLLVLWSSGDIRQK